MENYEEKLKLAEELYNKVRWMSSPEARETSITLEKIFPELKESEDDRIRKFVFKLINGAANISFEAENITRKEVFDWLEKQGEKSIPEDINEAALQYVDTCPVDGRVTHDNINEPYWNNHSMMAAYKAGWLEKQGKQKPSWSEEDEQNLNGIIDEIEANKNIAPDYDIAVCDRFLSWLKSLKPQQRQEWSEDDK